ncbi:MAG: diaminopimelate dehydrogenase [Mailhella sp.]|nr:diaminopimelate dehydrogenase [Mailhella sp.]
MTIRIGIMGYGNLGRGVELAVGQNPDMELAAVFTRRDPALLKPLSPQTRVMRTSEAGAMKDEIDVMIVCGGSATDLPSQTPQYASMFNIVDSFDTHARIPEHFAAVDAAASKAGKLALISAGWDPGLFSLNRLIASAVLPEGKDYTFWGPGVSQGHSDAIRRIPGVKNGKQYTMPVESALESVRSGAMPDLGTRQKHTRVCYVVAEEGADKKAIEQAIVTMPNYFDEYDTTVHFISEDEFVRGHSAMPHGGFVLRSGVSGSGTPQLYEFSLKLGSNPEFTSSVLCACARAVARLASEGRTGAVTLFDIPPACYSPLGAAELRAHLL